MNTNWAKWSILIVLASGLAPGPVAQAEAPEGTMAIEQDWRVALHTVSDFEQVAFPQYITGFAIPRVPALFQITWNHRDMPFVEEGGIQLQAYSWDELEEESEVVTPPWRERLAHDNETVTWTQRLQVSGLDYVFTVRDIVGTTWGNISEPYSVKRSFLEWAPPLELYTFEEIRRNSGVTAGANRFKELVIVETRFYDHENTLLLRDTEERVVFHQPDFVNASSD